MADTGQPAGSAGSPAPLPAEGLEPEAKRALQGSLLLAGLLEEGLSKGCAESLSAALRTPVQIRLCGLQGCPPSDFLAGVEERSCCMALGVCAAGPDVSGQGKAAASAAGAGSHAVWLEVSPQIAFPMIDRLLGGAAQEWYVPRRALTAIERRLLQRVGEAAANCLATCWPPPRDRTAAVQWGCRMDLAPASTPPPPEAVLAQFAVSMGRHAGALRLCLPRESVAFAPEPSSGGADAPLATGNSPQPPTDYASDASAVTPAWGAGPLELSVEVPHVTLSDEELAQLEAGDILLTDTPADGEVLIRVAGIPRFYARLGASKGHKAIRITRRVDENG